jgi:signal transduction histidine kinase
VFEWNSYAFISLMCSLMSLASAILTLSARRQGESLLWGLLCILLSAWTLGLFFTFSAEDPGKALFWARALNYIVIFVPAVLFHFCVRFVGRGDYFKRVVGVYYLVSLAFFLIVLISPEQFLHSPSLRFSTFWFPFAGPVFYFMPLMHLLIIGHAVQILISAKSSQNKTQQRKANYLLTTITIAFLGAGSSWALEFGLDIPPYGIISIAVVVLIATYAILRHDLLDLPETFSFITARILIYIIIFAVVVGVIKGGAFFDNLSFSSFQIAIISLLMVLVCELYAVMKNRVQQLSDRMLTRRKQENERNFKRLLGYLEQAADFESMLPRLRSFFEDQPYIYHFAWYLDQSLLTHNLKKISLDEFQRSHNLKDTSYQRILFSALDGKRHDRLPASLHMSGQILNTEKATSQMIALMNSEQLDQAYHWVDQVPGRELIALPLIANERFRGLLMFVVSQDDIQPYHQMMLQTLAAKLAVLVERFDAIREASRIQQVFLLEKMTTLQALAGSIAHEMRSPLNYMDHFVSEVFDAGRHIQALTRTLTIENSNMADVTELDSLAGRLRAQSAQARKAIERSLQVIDITLRQVHNKEIDRRLFETLFIQDVVSKALAEYVFLPGERELIHCDLSRNFAFQGDEHLLIFAIFNLLKNALYQQHYRNHYEIYISSEQRDSFNWLKFRDTGPGIPAEQLDKVFNEFYSTNSSQGTGLGLAYCRRVMLAFDGRIECVSELGEFTEFRLGFPVNPGKGE